MKKIFIFMFTLFCWKHAMAFRITQDFQQGFYWSSLPVSMVVMDQNSARLALIAQKAQEAVQEWENSLFTNNINDLWNVSSQQGSPVSNKNIIRWSTNFGAETGLSETSTLAVAVRYTGGPYIARAEIIINGNHQLNSFPEQLKTVLIHELGHTLGLDHSEVSEAVMAPTLQLNYNGLQSDDLNGIEYTLNETQRRQAIGYVSPLSKQQTTTTSPLSCGTIDISGGPGNGGGSNPIISLGFGLLLAIVILAPRFRGRRS
ncbi:MAG: matrixin family metalloprotease [Bacteriovoracaceae bacterium]|nr:matrixin family metalloprotease [Bacteriovoracaceae bacterium]